MDYYPIQIEWRNITYYAIYQFSDYDTLLSFDGYIFLFESMDMMTIFLNAENIQGFHDERVPVYNINNVSDFVFDNAACISQDCAKELLRAWDLFDDLTEDINFSDVEFSVLSSDSRWLHSKLVGSADLFSEDSSVRLSWTRDEIAELKEIVIMGLSFFGKIMDEKVKIYYP